MGNKFTMKINMKELNYKRYEAALIELKNLAECYESSPVLIGQEIVDLLLEFEL